MGNFCDSHKYKPVITSFSDHMPMPKAKETNNTNISKQIEDEKQQPKEHSVSNSAIKNKVSNSRVQSEQKMSKASQVKNISMQKAVIVPPSQIGYDKIESLQLLSQVPSDFFNQCNMSKFFVPGNSKISTNSPILPFNNIKTQSKIEELPRSPTSPAINFYLKSHNNENDGQPNQRYSKSQLKETTSTSMSNDRLKNSNKSAIQMIHSPKQSTLNFKKKINLKQTI